MKPVVNGEIVVLKSIVVTKIDIVMTCGDFKKSCRCESGCEWIPCCGAEITISVFLVLRWPQIMRTWGVHSSSWHGHCEWCATLLTHSFSLPDHYFARNTSSLTISSLFILPSTSSMSKVNANRSKTDLFASQSLDTFFLAGMTHKVKLCIPVIIWLSFCFSTCWLTYSWVRKCFIWIMLICLCPMIGLNLMSLFKKIGFPSTVLKKPLGCNDFITKRQCSIWRNFASITTELRFFGQFLFVAKWHRSIADWLENRRTSDHGQFSQYSRGVNGYGISQFSIHLQFSNCTC